MAPPVAMASGPASSGRSHEADMGPAATPKTPIHSQRTMTDFTESLPSTLRDAHVANPASKNLPACGEIAVMALMPLEHRRSGVHDRRRQTVGDTRQLLPREGPRQRRQMGHCATNRPATNKPHARRSRDFLVRPHSRSPMSPRFAELCRRRQRLDVPCSARAFSKAVSRVRASVTVFQEPPDPRVTVRSPYSCRSGLPPGSAPGCRCARRR